VRLGSRFERSKYVNGSDFHIDMPEMADMLCASIDDYAQLLMHINRDTLALLSIVEQ